MTGCADQLMGWQISSHQQSPDLSHDTSDDQPHDTSADDYDDDDYYYNDEYDHQIKVSTKYVFLFFPRFPHFHNYAITCTATF